MQHTSPNVRSLEERRGREVLWGVGGGGGGEEGRRGRQGSGKLDSKITLDFKK